MRVDGQGERQGVMDPNTVGQAPKEHPLPRDEEPPAPGYVAQAQSMAGQAVEQAKAVPAVVMSAVGMGGPKEEAPKEGVGKREDPAVDQMEGRNVEEFLREKSRSKPEAARS